ncbi:hypothetical protein [uncultured Shewanella sp.]|uniref:hypothetical protein n=1 Tax=uncultured Shewanella sp. TaxID=173975 RepID=UPI00262EB1C1|nr:hypothetical protein [uncultured Shewanella sp.]
MLNINTFKSKKKVYGKVFWGAISNELLFTLLPIAIIFIIRLATDSVGTEVWLWPDWSFASIILVGSALTRFIQIKSADPLDGQDILAIGSRLIIFVLVLSVVTLSLSVLKGSGLNVQNSFVTASQKIVFCISVLLVFWAHYLSGKSWFTEIDNNTDYYRWALRNADYASQRVTYLIKITETCANHNKRNKKGLVRNIDEDRHFKQLEKKLEIVSEQANYLVERLEELKHNKQSQSDVRLL